MHVNNILWRHERVWQRGCTPRVETRGTVAQGMAEGRGASRRQGGAQAGGLRSCRVAGGGERRKPVAYVPAGLPEARVPAI